MKSHDIECECRSCALMRVVYALLVARNHDEIKRKDFEWAILTLSHAETMEGIH